ncbi:GntR family transcriptional regulator [Chitinophaga sp. MM2321]|uniref:GntR family transcriptional regulator n=1 Tax=Chitinophaga sp. MM2321 TaxID=3137178 RepID=UPI0032D568E3
MKVTANIPLYKRLIGELKTSIDNGVYKKGDLLPSENDLCKTYATTRSTVRQALTGLTNLGYIVRKHGKGSIVSEPSQGLGILSLSGVTGGIGAQALTTDILQKPTKQAWPEDFFFPLSEEDQQHGCIFFARLRYINNIPVLYEETYLTNFNLPHFCSRSLENRSLFNILNKYYQVEVREGEQKIWAVPAGKNIGKLLDIKTTHPVVHMKRKLQTNTPGLNIFSSLYCNTADYFLQDYF